MIFNVILRRYIYFSLSCLILLFMNDAFSQDKEITDELDPYSLAGIKNNHHLKKISDNWELIIPQKNISTNTNLPILLPGNIEQIIFRKNFQIPDFLRNHDLVLWLPHINGLSNISINNIHLLERMNLPSAFKIQVPINLLNISSDNTLDIVIRKPKSVDEGMPMLVKIFSPKHNLGILGDLYLEWLPHAYFEGFQYSYKKNKVSFDYNLVIDEQFLVNYESNPKIRCQELIKDSNGNTLFNRFEYIDSEPMNKRFASSTYINTPKLWSSDTPEMYTIILTAKSGTGLIASFQQKIGLKEISISNQQMMVNNQQLKIKGINYRHEFQVYDSELDLNFINENLKRKIRDDFKNIKSLGFNTVRFPNTTPHPYCFYVADSLGLYIFCDIGLWRIPEDYFRDDQLLQISKNVADDIIQLYGNHPSFLSLGIGNEIPIHLPSVKKYMLILKGYIEQKSAIKLHLTPLNINLISQHPITEFYLVNKYDLSFLTEYDNIFKSELMSQRATLMIGNIGFSLANFSKLNDQKKIEEMQSSKMQRALEIVSSQENLGGFFVDSYQDWSADSPARLSSQDIQGLLTYPYGLISYDNKRRDLFYKIPKLLKGEYENTAIDIITSKKSNFFSISVLVFSIAIVYIYRKNYRFRENLKRSMAHPYGFFVDLRDRRIISILNSTIIGLYTNFLVASIIAAYIYYMRDNILIEEALSSILVPLQAKSFYLELIKYTFFITVAVWLGFYLLQLTIVILLKIINLFAAEKIRFKQYLAVCNWAGAPLVLLFPVSMLSYHLMYYQIARPLMIIILLLFFFLVQLSAWERITCPAFYENL